MTPSGAAFPVSDLDGKLVLLFFSAQWCGPCRHFSKQVLSQWTERHRVQAGFEVVFISSDNNKQDMEEYHSTMTFPALAYDERELHDRLVKTFSIQGYPTLLVLSPEGEIIMRNARSLVEGDPACKVFPWAVKSLSEVISAPLLPAGTGIDGADVVALYFSASWCASSRTITPLLINTYNAARAKGHKFEVIFVSADKDEKSFASYFAQMPWLAIPFDDHDTRNELDRRFEAHKGIPHAVLIDRTTCKVINKDAVGALRADQEATNFPWVTPPVEELTARNGPDLYLSVVVWLVNGAKDELEPAANAIHAAAAAQGKDATIKFFYSNDGTDREEAKWLFSFLGVPVNTDKEQVIVIDVPSGFKYVFPAGVKQDIASIAKRLAAGEALENPVDVCE